MPKGAEIRSVGVKKSYCFCASSTDVPRENSTVQIHSTPVVLKFHAGRAIRTMPGKAPCRGVGGGGVILTRRLRDAGLPNISISGRQGLWHPVCAAGSGDGGGESRGRGPGVSSLALTC